MALFHFSDDPAIERFTPHVPATNPQQQPAVWAIDAEHAPLYWFPRDCPRVTTWSRDAREQIHFAEAFRTAAARVHAIELDWLPAMSSAVLYRYRFDGSDFRPWAEASGQWTNDEAVVPIEVEPFDDLIGCHVAAGIELRAVPNLWPFRISGRSAIRPSVVPGTSASSGFSRHCPDRTDRQYRTTRPIERAGQERSNHVEGREVLIYPGGGPCHCCVAGCRSEADRSGVRYRSPASTVSSR